MLSESRHYVLRAAYTSRRAADAEYGVLKRQTSGMHHSGERILLMLSEGGIIPSKGGTTLPEGGNMPSEGGVLTAEGGMTSSEGDMMLLEGGIVPSKGGKMAPEGGMLTVEGGMTPFQGGMMHSEGAIIPFLRTAQRFCRAAICFWRAAC